MYPGWSQIAARPLRFKDLAKVASALFRSSHLAIPSPALTLALFSSTFIPNEALREVLFNGQLSKLPALPALRASQPAPFFVEFIEKVVIADNVTLIDVGSFEENSLHREPYKHYPLSSEKSSQGAIGAPRTYRYLKSFRYLYRFITSEDEPGRLGHIYKGSVYMWDFPAMLAMSFAANPRLAPFAVSHNSVVIDVQSSAKDLTKVLIDDDLPENKFANRRFNPQTYRPEKTLLDVFQAERVQDPLRAA